MKVEDIMTKNVKCCAADATLAKAAQLMWEQDCGCMPVCDGAGRVIGMITDRDVCMAAWTKGLTLQELRVGDAMAHGIVSCRLLDPVGMVETQMQHHQLHRLPVLDENDRLAGIVSLADIVRCADEPGTRSTEADHVVHTVAAVCRPRSRSAGTLSIPSM